MKYEIQYTEKYKKLFCKLSKDKQVLIDKRLISIKVNGYFGDYKSIDKDLFELRIFSSGGIRVYFTIKNNIIVVLLTIGAKESKEQQQKDILIAKDLLKQL